jgi:hypothetical protein
VVVSAVVFVAAFITAVRSPPSNGDQGAERADCDAARFRRRHALGAHAPSKHSRKHRDGRVKQSAVEGSHEVQGYDETHNVAKRKQPHDHVEVRTAALEACPWQLPVQFES